MKKNKKCIISIKSTNLFSKTFYSIINADINNDV